MNDITYYKTNNNDDEIAITIKYQFGNILEDADLLEKEDWKTFAADVLSEIA